MLRRLPLVCALVATSILVYAQLPTATLNGTVTDPQGAVVTNAKVTTTNLGTGVARSSTTDSAGFYSFTNLEPGDYSVKVEASSFAAGEVKQLRLEVGKASTVDVKLSPAKAGEVVEVTAAQSGVELTQSEVQGQITSTAIETLPLNGRNFLELAYLVPGNRPATNFDPTKTNTLEVSSAGAFGRGGNITVDGADNNDEVVGGTLMNFPQDSVKEFQIATNRFTSEVGRSSSSIVNIVTKSGENAYHGSGFFFFRQKSLQARPAILPASEPTPPFIREQFGGSIGGPIKKDKAWWFVSSEYRNQNHAVPVGFRDFATDTVVSSTAPAFVHDYLLSSRVDYKATENDTVFVRYSFNRSLDIDNGSLRQPAGSSANRQSSLNRFNSVLADWNHLFSSRTLNDLSFHIDYFLNSIPAFSPDAPITNPAGLAAASLCTTTPFAECNEIRFPDLQDGGNFRIAQSTKFNRYELKDTMSWILGNHTLRFGGEWQNIGTFALFDLFGSGSIFTTQDFATQLLTAGTPFAHSGPPNDADIPIAVAIQSGAKPRPPIVPFYRDAYFGSFIQDDWKALSNLTLNLGLRWEFDDILGDSTIRPCASLTDASKNCEWLNNILPGHDGPKLNQWGPRVGFAWDPFKRGETVVRGGYGIYYDRVVTEVPLLPLLLNGRILPLNAFTGSNCAPAGAAVGTLTGDCSSPGSTFVCASPNPNSTLPPLVASCGTPGVMPIVTLANPFAGLPASFGVGINYINPNAKHPYVQQFTFGVQQQIKQNWLVSVDGLHDFGVHNILGRFLRTTSSTSPLISCPNGFDPCNVTDPTTGQVNQVTDIESVAKSWYDAMLVTLQKRQTGTPDFKWGFNINYTLSKTFNYSNDDQIPFNGEEDAVNLIFHSNDLNLEKGYSPTDERHRFVFYGLFDVPWKVSFSPRWTWSSSVPEDFVIADLGARLPILPRNALGREITNGSQLDQVISAWNALPACTGLNQIPCNPGVILPPVPAGMSFGHDFNSFDLRITKTWNPFEGQSLQFITDIFNIANHANIRGFNNNNYSGVNNRWSSDPTSSVNAQFNQPNSIAGKFFGDGGPRAFQFALRYAF